MKQTHKAALDTTASRQPVAYQGHSYTVTITRVADGDGHYQPLTNKTFRLKDLPGLLQALDKIEG